MTEIKFILKSNVLSDKNTTTRTEGNFLNLVRHLKKSGIFIQWNYYFAIERNERHALICFYMNAS